jgi:hypothetical protein
MIKHSNFYFLLLLLLWDRTMADSPWTSLLDGSKDNGDGVGGGGFSSGGVGGNGLSGGGVGDGGFSSGGVGGGGFSSGVVGDGGFISGGEYGDSWFEGEPISAAETDSEVEREEEVAVHGSGWTRYC